MSTALLLGQLALALGFLGFITRCFALVGVEPSVDAEQLAQTLAQIRYAVDVMGIEGVGIGTHFNSACMPWVLEGLLDAGFGEGDVAKICGANYLRVLRNVLPA